MNEMAWEMHLLTMQTKAIDGLQSESDVDHRFKCKTAMLVVHIVHVYVQSKFVFLLLCR